MKTDYAAHDELYKRLKAEGKSGWSTSEHIQQKVDECLIEYAPKTGRLLELGCGDGKFSLELAKKGFDVYGVDISRTAIAWAIEKAKIYNLKADFRVGDVLNLKGYNDEYFDLVIDGSCLHCIIGKDRNLCLNSVYRVLKPGGFFHVRTWCGEIKDEETRKTFDPVSRCLIRQGDIAYRYIGLAEDILDEIRTAGFDILHYEVKKSSEKPKLHTTKGERLLVAAIKP